MKNWTTTESWIGHQVGSGALTSNLLNILTVIVAVHLSSPFLRAKDWPMLGRDPTRNAVSPEKGAPTDWDVDTGRNIKWKASLGSIAVSEPIIAGGLIWVGTNNDSPHDPAAIDPAGILACFRERDGKFLYQFVSRVTNGVGTLNRRALFGMTCSPLIENDRVWFVSTAAQILCLDTKAFRRKKGLPETVWQVDMPSEFDIYPAVDIMGGKGLCSIGASFGGNIYVITGNGMDWTRSNVPMPEAPALVCLNKNTGKVVWEDHSSGTNILFGEYASLLVIKAGRVCQVVTPQGDGWVRSFEAKTGKLLWKFDINPKATKQKSDRNFFENSPVCHDGRIYFAGGRDVESGPGPGRLVCLDPTKRGDLSLELQDRPGHGMTNPNSGAIWHFDGCGRTLSNPVIHNGFVIVVDFRGIVHFLNDVTGTEYWTHDMGSHVWG